MPARLKVASLFAGAGGLDIGFEATGAFETVLAIDWADYCTDTLERNRARKCRLGLADIAPWLVPHTAYEASALVLENAIIAQRDLALTSADDIRRLYAGELDGIVGGPPCQSFSTRARNRHLPRGLDDVHGRGNLVFTFFDLIRDLRPRFFLFENVLGLERDDIGNVFETLLSYGRQHLPYHLHVSRVDASDFGVAQARRRIVIVGFRDEAGYSPPTPTHGTTTLFDSSPLLPRRTVRDAFAGLPQAGTGQLTNHEPRKHSQEVIERFATIAPGKEDPVRKKPRLHPLRPAPAVFSGSVDGGGLSDIHPWENRATTPRECARLQGFPDSWEFVSTRVGEVYKLVANAVPAPMAAAFALRIAMALVPHPAPRSA
jgi:DNA (cytosine-5)-methyltransferase 1